MYLQRGSNSRPLAYKTSALPLSYRGINEGFYEISVLILSYRGISEVVFSIRLFSYCFSIVYTFEISQVDRVVKAAGGRLVTR